MAKQVWKPGNMLYPVPAGGGGGGGKNFFFKF